MSSLVVSQTVALLRTRRGNLPGASTWLFRCFGAALLTLTLHVVRLEASDSLLLQYRSLDTVATYHIVDADSIVSITNQMPRGRSMEIRIWLTDDVSARMLVEGLNMWPDILGLSLYRGRAEVIDSVLSLVVLPRLEGVTLTLASEPTLPRHLSRFPRLTTLVLESIDAGWPCIDPDSVPNIEEVWVYGSLRYSNCRCVPQRLIVKGLPANPDLGFDHERLFVLTGAYTASSCVYDLVRSMNGDQFRDTIPIVGGRLYALRVHGQQRLQIAEGIIDRILAVLIAQAQRGERVFDGEPTTVNAEFLRVVRDTSTTTQFEIESDRLIINGAFVYRGPLMTVINEMIEDGCL